MYFIYDETRCDVLVQRKTVMETWPELHKAVREALKSLSPGGGSTMVAADLGCSSGPNTLLVASEVMNTIGALVQETADNYRSRAIMEVQFFLYDLPGNDFNLVFRSLENLQNLASETEADDPELPCYVAGLPGSFYTRLFPSNSVHLFHSSYSLMWQSKVLPPSPIQINKFLELFYGGRENTLVLSVFLFSS